MFSFFVCLVFFSQRKVNSTGRCVSIVMQLSTVELACLITSGLMQNEKELPYLREPVSQQHTTKHPLFFFFALHFTLKKKKKKDTQRYQDSFRFLIIVLVLYVKSHF